MSGYLECKFCLKKFVRRANYDKHECRQMKRTALLRSNDGMSSYQYYCDWKRAKGHVVRSKEQFIESKYFVSFFKFVKFARKIALPGVDKFINYMVSMDLEPKDWTQQIVYDHYISEFDKIHDPDEQAKISVDTVFELSRIFDCETNEIFLHLEPSSLIQIIQAKKLSPWFLLVSSKFKWFIKNEMTREQQIILNKCMGAGKWRSKFEQEPETVQKMKDYVRALGL